MRVVQVYQTNPFYDGQGGGARYLKNLTKALSYQGCRILFLGIGKKEKKENVDMMPITKNQTGYIKFLFRLIILLPFIKLNNTDIVHVHRLYFAIPFIILKPKVKVICTLHGRTFSVFKSNYGGFLFNNVKILFRLIEKFSIKNVDFFIPVSADVLNDFVGKYKKFPINKTKIIGSAVDVKEFNLNNSNVLQELYGPQNKYILFLGRLSDVKDVQFLIRLWAEKFSKNSEIKLVIAGGGELKNELMQLSGLISLSNPPLFIGEVLGINVPPLISSSVATILCSKHEASPTVIKESLFCGVPVITNNVGDVKEYIVNGANGFIVNKDFESYFESILSLISQPLAKEKVFEFSKASLNRNNIFCLADMYLDVYNQLLKGSYEQ